MTASLTPSFIYRVQTRVTCSVHNPSVGFGMSNYREHIGERGDDLSGMVGQNSHHVRQDKIIFASLSETGHS